MKLTKKAYLHGFTVIVLLLGVLRLTTDIEEPAKWKNDAAADSTAVGDTIIAEDEVFDSETQAKVAEKTEVKEPDDAKSLPNIADDRKPHRILSVPRYDDAFPDLNDVQLTAAQKWGVKPVENSADAEKRSNELVYVGASPWFYVDRLKTSSPYLVPRAAMLLQDIGRAFCDSLDVKRVPLHKIRITSVLRTKEDVARLRTRNFNATENSCHLYGTTFDIAQNRYKTVEDPHGPKRREVTNDTLKWVLSEVLRDMRESGRCYVKYEKKQGCFHVTVR